MAEMGGAFAACREGLGHSRLEQEQALAQAALGERGFYRASGFGQVLPAVDVQWDADRAVQDLGRVGSLVGAESQVRIKKRCARPPGENHGNIN